MPVNLPGFYFDEEKNRYFPLSSRPKQAEPVPRTIASDHNKDEKAQLTETRNKTVRKRILWSPWHGNMSMRLRSPHLGVQRFSHEILCSHYASSSRRTTNTIPTFGTIQAFRSVRLGDIAWRFIGDDQGWLYNDRGPGFELHNGSNSWSADINLQHASPISSISASGSHCVATCLGPGKISVQDLTTPERVFLLNINNVFDIWASNLVGSTLTLGASRKAVYIPDVDISTSPEYLHTSSDALSIHQRKILVYVGTRNGTVERFDMRMPKQQKQKLFDDRFQDTPRSSVLYLKSIREHELLMSHLNGDLLTYDLRYISTTSTSSPIRIYHGHVNTHTRNLGITVDEEHSLLFAAGQDSRIRAWSIRTGAPLIPPEELAGIQADCNPFSTVFSEPISALQVTEEGGEAGTSLWAASGRNLHQFHLGQRAPWNLN